MHEACPERGAEAMEAEVESLLIASRERAVVFGRGEIDLFGVQGQHDRALHFAGMVHPPGRRCTNACKGLRRQRPIRGQHDPEVWDLNLHFAQSGAAGYVISAMAIEQKDLVKSHRSEGTAEVLDDGHVACEVQAHATEMSVMRRVTNRLGRRKQHLIG